MSDSLNDLVNNVIGKYPGAETKVLAKEVYDRILPQEVEGWVLELLEDRVKKVIRDKLNSAVTAATSGKVADSPTSSAKASAGEQTATKAATGKGKVPQSARLTKAAREWAKMLEEKIVVNEGQNKPLGDCTIADLDKVIQRRRDHIAAVDVFVQKYTKMRDILANGKLETVRQIKQNPFA